MRVLVLSKEYEPIGTCSWQDAIVAVYLEKAQALEYYDSHISSPSKKFQVPSVIVYGHTKKYKHKKIKFSKHNLYLRDEGMCQYCQILLTKSTFTVDHVVPRSKGGASSFENCVVCCYDCNQRKNNKTLKEVGMKLYKKPVKPTYLPNVIKFEDYDFMHYTWKKWLGKE